MSSFLRRPLFGAVVLFASLPLLPVAATAAPDEARVLSFLRDWSAAWQAQDLDAYLALYAGDARVGRRDRAAHAAHKGSVFARGESIELELGDAEIDASSAGGESLLRVRALQSYRSPSLSDFGRKELLLRSTPAGLRIVRETWSAASGSITTPLSVQLAAAVAPAPAPPAPAGGEPAAVAADLPPEPEFTPLDTRPPASAPGTEDLQPMLGEGYAPPADAVADGRADGDLLAIEPLVRDDLPAFLRPVSFPGLPGDIEDRTMVEEVVARVNGRVLTRSAFVERLEGRHLQLMIEQAPDLERRLELIVSETLAQVVERWLLVQEADVNRAEVEAFWRQQLQFLRQQVGAESIQEFEELLAQEGMTLTMLREQVVANEVVQQRVTTKIDRSDERLLEYYEDRGGDWALPARVRLRQILVPVPAGADASRAESALVEALAQLESGAEWCDVHAVYGQGAACGELGELELDDLLPEMREVAAGLPIDAVSKPIRTSAGLHLVQVRERAEVTVPPFEELREQIERAVISLEFDRLLEDYLGDLRSTAVIEINPRYEPLWEAVGVGQ